MVNSDLYLNEFAMEIFKVKKPIKEQLTGKFDNVKLTIEYKPVKKVKSY